MFDVIVIGGGHAGIEAALVAERRGLRVAMVTMTADSIGRMSCNPAIGGLAKGHLVGEIDALGGFMGRGADLAGIQFKLLNRSKGPAVQGPRAQCDRDLYAAAARAEVESREGITIIEGIVDSLLLRENTSRGVRLGDQTEIPARAVIVTTGTFLRGLMHSGDIREEGGRFGEPPAKGLSRSLEQLGLRMTRLKTGTPPRVERESVDFSRMKPDSGDEIPRMFSIESTGTVNPQIDCYITHTSEKIHDLIRANIHRAPMYSGQINAAGPRYCPSIEDKVVRFSEKSSHHVFVEPEGLTSPWLYLNGISTSLPHDIQDEIVHSLPGFERAEIARYGYAVEYDAVDPVQLGTDLSVKGIEGLYLAGQINGTSGYEEAAAQGLIAGLGASIALQNDESFILARDTAYTAVMIDDLTTLGAREPYRMFTSRAEYRLLLGCDTVYERLYPLASRYGLLSEPRRRLIEDRLERVARARDSIEGVSFNPDRETAEWLEGLGLPITTRTELRALMQRRELDISSLIEDPTLAEREPILVEALRSLDREELEGVVSQTRYAGYLERQRREAEKVAADENLRIPTGFDYARPGLSNEVLEKLRAVRPSTLGQAGRIPGVTPPAVSILRMHLRNPVRSDHEAAGELEPEGRSGPDGRQARAV